MGWVCSLFCPLGVREGSGCTFLLGVCTSQLGSIHAQGSVNVGVGSTARSVGRGYFASPLLGFPGAQGRGFCVFELAFRPVGGPVS